MKLTDGQAATRATILARVADQWLTAPTSAPTELDGARIELVRWVQSARDILAQLGAPLPEGPSAADAANSRAAGDFDSADLAAQDSAAWDVRS